MPDNETKAWIQTTSGLKIDLMNPDPTNINVYDIAYALAGINRYTGHTRPRYNVAEHCVRVSNLAQRRALAMKLPNDQVDMIAKWGLMHDAAEAYIGDVSRPVKNMMRSLMPPGVADPYEILEDRWDNIIANRFGLPRGIPAIVRKADYDMLGVEADQLMRPIHPEWGSTCPEGGLPPPDRSQQLGWSSFHAEICFLDRFRTLFEKLP